MKAGEMTSAEAEAVTEVAKTAGKAIDLARGVGGYLKETLDTVPHDLIGLAGGDWLHQQRRRNIAKMQARTERILEGVERERISEPSVSVVVPLLEAAADEGREELQDLWAGLLASAMMDGGRKVRRAFFETLRKLEPTDALVLEIYGKIAKDTLMKVQGEYDRFISDERERLHISELEWDLSVVALGDAGLGDGGHPGPPMLTLYGTAFLSACCTPREPAHPEPPSA